MRPSVAPCALQVQDAVQVSIVFKLIRKKGLLCVDHKMHAMLWSHEALCGSMCSLTSSRCTCTHCFENSFKRKRPYGSTIKCTQCYGAMRPSVAPCALRAQDAVHVFAMEPSSRPWLHGFSMLQTLYPLFSDLL